MTLVPEPPDAPSKVAVTVSETASVRLHVEAPLQAPDHDKNILLVAGFSVNVTAAFVGKTAEHVEGQLIPGGVLRIVPDPVPAIATVSDSPRLKTAETCLRVLSLRLQPPLMPEQPLVHPAK